MLTNMVPRVARLSVVRWGLLAACLTLTLGGPTRAEACMCRARSVAEAREEAHHVFEGELIRTVEARNARPPRLIFRVGRVWKGEVPAIFPVQGRAGFTDCPPFLEVGRHYIIYTGGTPDAPRVFGCAHYATPDRIAAEAAELGEPIATHRRRR